MTLREICRALLQIDTSNPGATEEAAAAFIVGCLEEARLPVEVIEPAPGRCSVVSRVRGRDDERPPLLIHGHLDVVPAVEGGWTYDPFGGIEADGYLWGRGAVDMKAAIAMMVALQLELGNRRLSRRQLVFAYFADEEMGGGLGSRWIVENRPDLFDGVREAIGEIGGFRVELPSGRGLYPIQAAERGVLWVKLTVPGDGGHVAFAHGRNALVRAAELVKRIVELRTDDPSPEAVSSFEDALGQLVAADDRAGVESLGAFGTMVGRAARTSFVPTVLASGEKVNVVPKSAEVIVDCRIVPGCEESAIEALRSVLDEDMRVDILMSSNGFTSPLEGPLLEACAAAVSAIDPGGVVVPYLQAAGTDAQRLNKLGITGYGFTPLVLPAAYDYFAMFHAVDERIPIASIERGYEVLRRLAVSY